jgi:hypothetical protein
MLGLAVLEKAVDDVPNKHSRRDTWGVFLMFAGGQLFDEFLFRELAAFSRAWRFHEEKLSASAVLPWGTKFINCRICREWHDSSMLGGFRQSEFS